MYMATDEDTWRLARRRGDLIVEHFPKTLLACE